MSKNIGHRQVNNQVKDANLKDKKNHNRQREDLDHKDK